MELTYDLIAKRIDHSLLQPTLTESEMARGCELARDYGTASVCIKPSGVSLAVSILQGTGGRRRHHDRLPARRPPLGGQALRGRARDGRRRHRTGHGD